MAPHASPFPYGLSPVPRDPSVLTPAFPTSPPAVPIDKLLATIPTTPLVTKALEYLTPLLTEPILNHSHRAYLSAVAIVTVQFAEFAWDEESFFLACLFHDLAATPKNIRKTKMSFETYGAILAREWLLATAEGEPSQDLRDLADSVAETISRHTDLNVGGFATTHVQMVQIGTLFDNIGAHAAWIHADTARAIYDRYPRQGWTGCFAGAMKDEVNVKPWAHTTFFDDAGVWEKVAANPVGAEVEAREAGRAEAGAH